MLRDLPYSCRQYNNTVEEPTRIKSHLESYNFGAIYRYFNKLLYDTMNLFTDVWSLFLRPLSSFQNVILVSRTTEKHRQSCFFTWIFWHCLLTLSYDNFVTFYKIRNFNRISSEFLLTISSSHLSTLTISVSSASAWFLRQYAVHPFIKSQESHHYLETDWYQCRDPIVRHLFLPRLIMVVFIK